MYEPCPNCATPIAANAKECTHCGAIFDVGATWKPGDVVRDSRWSLMNIGVSAMSVPVSILMLIASENFGAVVSRAADGLGLLYWAAVYLGAPALFGAPILAFLSNNGFIWRLPNRQGVSLVCTRLGAIVSSISGVIWLTTLLSMFAGGPLWFLRLWLPALGASTGAACLLLIAGHLTADRVKSETLSDAEASDGA